MRILILTQYFEPEPLVKGLVFARELVARGHDVQVLTGVPNYPGGRVYNGYRMRRYQTESMGNVLVHRVALYPSHDRSALRRIATYCSFALTAAVIGPLVTFRPDVIYVYHSPATLAIPAVILRLFKGGRVVSDIQDLWPDTVLTSGMGNPRLFRLPLTWLCNLAYLAADRIVVPSPGMKRILSDRGIDPHRVDVIYNWSDEVSQSLAKPRSVTRAALDWDDRFVVLFAGMMGLMQGLDTLLDAAALLRTMAPRTLVALIGGGIEAPRLQARAAREGLDNVKFYPQVPRDEIHAYLAAADALLVHLKPDPLYEALIPSKTQAYMAAGRPIVMAVSGDAAELVQQAQCGVTATPGNPESLAKALEALATKTENELIQMGQNGRQFYTREISLQSGVTRFTEVFRTI